MKQPLATRILVLEDNSRRREAMRECLADRLHAYEVRFFEAPQPFLTYVREHLDDVICIGLDHDMELVDDGSGKLVDPGTGREVADYLATRVPQCPVVIHTTNTSAAIGMDATLRHAGWVMYRVTPYGDLEWIRGDWIRTIRPAIRDTAKPERS
jgi:CheY-like chemotaxis protein